MVYRRAPVLTGQEKAFVAAYVPTGDASYAAEKAGYRHPKIVGRQTLERPIVRAEVERLQTERLWNEALPLAIQSMIDVLSDPKAPAAKWSAALAATLKHTIGTVQGTGDEDISDLDGAQLADRIAKFEAAAASRAKLIESAPSAQDGDDVFA